MWEGVSGTDTCINCAMVTSSTHKPHPLFSPQAPPINHTHLDGLNDLPEWQLSGQCIAVVDDGLTTPCYIESWGEGKRRDG